MNLKYTRLLHLIAFFSLTIFTARATVYQTVQSGNFSSAATWTGGLVPPTTLGATDTVYMLNSAPNIVMDRDLVIGHDNSYMTVDNSVYITESGKHYIAIRRGIFSQGGAMSIDSLYLSGNVHYFTMLGGLDTFKKLTLDSSANYKRAQSSSSYIKELLHVRNGLNNTFAYQAGMAPGATIYFSDNGGLVGSNIISLAAPYNLKYASPNNAAPGNRFDEFQGSGSTLRGIEIVDNVTLEVTKQNFEIMGELRLTSGAVRFTYPSTPYFSMAFTDAGRFGTIGTGTFTGSDSIQLTFASSSPSVTDLGRVKFTPGNEKLGLLSMYLQGGASGTFTVENDLTIKSHVSLTRGYLNIKNHMLDLPASTFGLSSGDANSYIMMEPGGSVRGKSGGGTIIFQIGTPSKYLPLSAIATGVLQVSVEEGVKENGSSGANIAAKQPAVDASWYLLNNTTLTDIKPGWKSASERNGFDRTKCYVSEFSNGSWSKEQAGSAPLSAWGNYYITRAGTSSGKIYAVFDVNTVLSVEELLNDRNVALYPNPATDVLQLSYSGNKKLNATIYDATGRAISTTAVTKGNNTIDVSSLQQGVYFLNIAGTDVNTVKRFVKK